MYFPKSTTVTFHFIVPRQPLLLWSTSLKRETDYPPLKRKSNRSEYEVLQIQVYLQVIVELSNRSSQGEWGYSHFYLIRLLNCEYFTCIYYFYNLKYYLKLTLR